MSDFVIYFERTILYDPVSSNDSKDFKSQHAPFQFVNQSQLRH